MLARFSRLNDFKTGKIVFSPVIRDSWFQVQPYYAQWVNINQPDLVW